jgi:hypothetical protein
LEDYGAEGRPPGQFASTALEQKRSPTGLRVKANNEIQKLIVKSKKYAMINCML